MEKKYYVNPMYDIESVGRLDDFEVVVMDRVESGYNTPSLIVDSINLELRKNNMPIKTPEEIAEVMDDLLRKNIVGTNEFGLPNSGINRVSEGSAVNMGELITCSSPTFESKVNIGFSPPNIPFSNPSIPIDKVPFESSAPMIPFTPPKI